MPNSKRCHGNAPSPDDKSRLGAIMSKGTIGNIESFRIWVVPS
jgi:hypothetical protein